MTPASSPTSARLPLDNGWELCWVPPGAAEDPHSLLARTPQWHSCAGIGTAAWQLKSLGLWSPDGPPLDFDADDWWFRCSFSVPGPSPTWTLGLDGVATIATVWLNERAILSSENMFLRHELDVTRLLSPTNHLYIRCHALRSWLETRRPRPRWKAPMVKNQQMRWVRTTLLGRTPGWSPSVAPVGPWRPVWLEPRTSASRPRIEIQTRLQNNVGTIRITAANLPAAMDRAALRLRVEAPRGKVEELELREDPSAAGALCASIEDPELWWPHTHGVPNLYHVEVRAGHQPLASADVGFRSIEIHEPESAFALHVNGERIFCRGACWTPLDIVSLNATDADVFSALADVAADGMNMVRIVGTMTYESDAFHCACDRLGILVWHDFMFANMDYPPTDERFLETVEAEIRQTLQRLRPHPSLAVLCGNSEVEQQSAMFGAPRELWTHPLFHEVIPRLVRESRIDAPYWPSSTHGRDPIAPSSGTTSYYGVGAYLLPLEDARRSEVHFATECLALANVPDEQTLRAIPSAGRLSVHTPEWKARVPRDLTAGWDFDDIRDVYLRQLFGVDPLEIRYADHDHYLQLSRAVSGEVMAEAFSQWRAGIVCNGALILFLRDLVAGAGWGLRSPTGRRKPALEILRRVLQPQAILLTNEGCNGIGIHIMNDRPVPLAGTLTVEFGRVTGRQSEIVRPVSVAARGALSLRLADLCDHFVDMTNVFRFGPPSSDYVAVRFAGNVALAPAFYFPPGRQFTRSDSIGLEAGIHPSENQAPTLSLSTRELARYVWVEIEGFTPEFQYIHLAPGETRTMSLYPSGRSQAPSGHAHALNSLRAARIRPPA